MSVTVTLRPDATTRTSGSVIVGPFGTTLHQALADDLDSTYAQLIDGGTSKVEFEAYDVPVGAIVLWANLFTRSRRSATAATMFCRLNNLPVIRFDPNISTLRTDMGRPTTGFSRQAIANKVALTIEASGPGVDVAEALLDVLYVERPTVTVTAPVGSVASTQPTVTWEESADFPQSHYQVKIFTQAQYEAPSFDPDGSAAVFDSGIQAGTADTLTPTENLPNGTTARFYVQTGQLIFDTIQWSLWDHSTATVNAAVPDVPSLTVEPDDLLARIKITVTQDDVPPPGDGYGSGPYGDGLYGGTTGGFGPFADQPWEFVTVERTNDGGQTWTTVRSANRARVFGAVFVAYDYESCNGEDVQYRAQAIGTSGGGDVASDWSALSLPVHWSSPFDWLKSPTLPALNIAVKIESIPRLSRRQPQGQFDVAGRADTVVVYDERKLPEGTVTLITLDLAGRDALDLLLGRSETLLLQTPAIEGFGCRYIACGDSDEDRVARLARQPERRFSFSFIEVTMPVGDVVGFGVTWADVIDQYATWDDALAANASWAELLGLV